VQTVQPLEVPISAVGGGAIAGQPGSAAIDMGPDTDQVYLVLFGTGIRYRSSLSNVTVDIGGAFASVEYAGAQGTFSGVDQVNVRLQRSLARSGQGTAARSRARTTQRRTPATTVAEVFIRHLDGDCALQPGIHGAIHFAPNR
jgi:uncharacterized protein (TIGR03437 family)